MSGVAGSNPLELSDDDFAKLNGPSVTAEEAAELDAANAAAAGATGDGSSSAATTDSGGSGAAETGNNGGGSGDDTDDNKDQGVSGADGAGDDAGAGGDGAGGAGSADDKSGEGNGEGDDDKIDGAAGAASGQDPAGEKPDGKADGDGKPKDGAQGEQTADGKKSDPDYAEFYKQIMTPFKANGKTIELKDPAEAIQLMQMGANYTRKMQELQPHRKMLMMLQGANLDEGKLSFLIDLDQKNPEAIKKLIKDSGIDPLDIDTSAEPAYTEGTHKITDHEARFRTTLDDVSQTDEGRQTIVEVNQRFDATSKQALWENPEILPLINEQRQNGVYDTITAEMDRQITLGKIPPNTPFLEAYRQVGDYLTAQAGGSPNASGQQRQGETGQAGKPATVVLDTRAAAPKPKVTNGDQASAASPTRSTPTTKQPSVNPLAMSDDAFMKQMKDRV